MERYRTQGMKGIANNTLESIDLPIERIIQYISNKVDSCYRTTTNQFESPQFTLDEYVSFNKLMKDLLEKDCMIHTLELEVGEKDMEIISLKQQIAHLNRKIDKSDSDSKLPHNKMRDYTPETRRYQPYLPNKLETPSNLDFSSIVDSSGSRYIYIPNSSSKNLIKYDIHQEKVDIIEIPTLERDFDTTSSCELPNGDVFIAGFKDSVMGEAYLYKPGSNKCIPILPMKYSRCLVALYYYKDYVYAFGGHCSNRAERYSLSNNSWESLPDMRYNRYGISCVGIEDKIYLFYGQCQNIEIFNTISLQFENYLLDNSECDASRFGVAYKVEDKVYLVTDNLIQVYDTTLIKLYQYNNTYSYRHYSIHNIILYNSSIYYYNYNTFTIEKVDTTPPILDPQPYSTHTTYLYKVRQNTRNIHRIDIEHFTLESIDLSTTMHRNFNLTSICILEYGDILIAGFNSPVSGECYLYCPTSNTCTRLPNLIYPRYSISLVYHNKYVYAFGGYDSSNESVRKAEKMNVATRTSWVSMQNMIQARAAPACICVDNRIYIMGGEDYSIEIYNILTDSYQFHHISLNSFDVVSVMNENRLYVIGDDEYKILTKDLQVISDIQDRWKSHYYTFNLGNTAYYQDSIYFFNEVCKILERVNSSNHQRDIQVIIHRVTHT